MTARETIYALASGQGRAGVAVLRISGPAAASVAERLSRRPPPPARRAVLRRLYRPDNGTALDDALLLLFKAPASFTGEDVLELHVHGGRAVVDALLGALGRLGGLRPAESGEFTRRAFENGRMDLTAAEGVGDLVMAETEAQRRQALRQTEGALGALYEGWRERLLDSLALLEAEIDFGDEELPEGLTADLEARIRALRDEVAGHLADSHRGERLREGLSVVILGPPNVGKSCLLNALAGREAAIVSETAGTTRDVIEVAMDLGGYPVSLVDTAGIREAAEAIEAEGVRRARARAARADLRLVMVEAAGWPEIPSEAAELREGAAFLVLNKADCGGPPPGRLAAGEDVFAVSARTGEGVSELLAAVGQRVAELCGLVEAPALTRQRHRDALTDCLAALDRVKAQRPCDDVLAAEDLRLAARALGRITGRVDVEDVLDIIFASFCIGK